MNLTPQKIQTWYLVFLFHVIGAAILIAGTNPSVEKLHISSEVVHRVSVETLNGNMEFSEEFLMISLVNVDDDQIKHSYYNVENDGNYQFYIPGWMPIIIYSKSNESIDNHIIYAPK